MLGFFREGCDARVRGAVRDEKDGGKRNKGEEPDLCGTQYTAPTPRLCFWGLQPVRFRSTYGTPRVRMQHLRPWKEGWKDVAGILHEFHHERISIWLGKVGLICVGLTVGKLRGCGKGGTGFHRSAQRSLGKLR